MARSKLYLKNIDMTNHIDLYKLTGEVLMRNFRPSELFALLKLEVNNNDLCTYVLKIHLEFLKLEAYEWNVITYKWMVDNCY